AHQKVINRLVDHQVLLVDRFDVHAQRNAMANFLQVRADRMADINNVGGLQAGHREGKGAFAVVVDQLARGVGGTAVHSGYVDQADLLGGAGTADAQRLNGSNRIKTGLTADADTATVDFHRAAGLHAVF